MTGTEGLDVFGVIGDPYSYRRVSSSLRVRSPCIINGRWGKTQSRISDVVLPELDLFFVLKGHPGR